MDTRSHAARLWFVVMLVAGISGATDRVQAAAIGAQLGADRSGVDVDTPPNSTYTDEFGLVAGLQGEFGVAHDLSLSLQPSFVQIKSGVSIAPATRNGSPTEFDLAFDYVSIPVVVKFTQA